MTRLIDADALHDALRKEQRWIVRKDGYVNEGYSYDQVHFAIDKQPTVEAEPVQWIPTNVALPNVGDRVLISTKKKVYIAEYTGENAKGHSVWHCYEEWEFHTFWEPEVKAWAVLPKVYGKRPEE